MIKKHFLFYLRLRLTEVENIANKKRRSIKNSPPGSLRGERQRGAWRYYLRLPGKPDTYISKKKIHLAHKLAQKGYDQQVVALAEKELAMLRELRNFYQGKTMEDALPMRPPSHQPLIRSLSDDEELFLKRWKSQKYPQRPFPEKGTPLYAKDGTRMRSKSEMTIANMIIDRGIPYLYEKPLTLDNGWNVHPDFTIYDTAHQREIYWEHFGIMDKAQYRETAIQKIYHYNASGYLTGKNLIFTIETEFLHLDLEAAEQQLNICLFPH